MSRLLPSKRDKSDSFGQPKCLKYETCHSVTLVSLKKADSLYGARTRVSECVNIPAGERKQMNFCLRIFQNIFTPLRVTRVTSVEVQGVGVSPFVSLVTLVTAFTGWSAADDERRSGQGQPAQYEGEWP